MGKKTIYSIIGKFKDRLRRRLRSKSTATSGLRGWFWLFDSIRNTVKINSKQNICLCVH
jgi:hypothetical protein